MAASRPSAHRSRAAVLPFPLRRRPFPALRLPDALPSRRSLAVGLALAVLAAAAYVAARETGVFAVRTIEVAGAPPVLAEEVRRALAPTVGTSLVRLDRGDALRRVEAVPAVRSATLDRAFPDTLVVSIRHEQPAAILRRGPEAWLVSDRGRLIRTLGSGAPRRGLARVWVPRAVEAEAGAILSHRPALLAVVALATLAREGSPVPVTDVRAGPDELTFLLASKLELRLGDARSLPVKLAVAAHILPGLAPPAAGGPTYLDVSLPDRPVAGRNPKPGA